MWDPGFSQPSTCHNRISSGSHSENGVPRSPMKASQGSYFPSDSPSSGVILTGPQVTTSPPTAPVRSVHLPSSPTFTHMEMRAPGLPKEGSQWRRGLVSPLLDCQVFLRCPPDKGPEASGLSTEVPETSEQPLPPGFPEAESLFSRDTAGEHPSG